MIEAQARTYRRERRFHFSWLGSIWLKPVSTLAGIAAHPRPSWGTPLLVLTLVIIVNVGISGWLRGIAAMSGEVQLPPDFQYYPPEYQERLLQAMSATSSPAFLYLLPGLSRLIMLWGGWLLVGSSIHLVTTIMGGRASMAASLNLVAWAGAPLILRELVRVGAMLATRQMIHSPGLSGFAPDQAGDLGLYLSKLLSLLDVYFFWQVSLIAIGVVILGEIPARKAWVGVALTMLSLLALQALGAFGLAKLAGLTITRPFLF